MSRAGLFGLQGTHAGCDDIRSKIKDILKTSRTFIGVFKCRLTLDEYTGEFCFPDLSVFDNVRKGEALELDYGGRAYFQKGNRLGQNVEIRDTVLTGENISRMVSMQTCCDNGFGSVMNLPSGDFSFFFGQLVVRHILRLANRSKNMAGSQMAYVLYHQGFLADGEFRATSQSWYHPDLVREMGFSEGSKLRMKIAIAKDVRKFFESGGWDSNCLGGILKLQEFLQEKLHSLKIRARSGDRCRATRRKTEQFEASSGDRCAERTKTGRATRRKTEQFEASSGNRCAERTKTTNFSPGCAAR